MKIILKKTQWFTMITTLCLVVITLFAVSGCNELETPSINEEIDPTLLIGEWDCIKFAHIAKNGAISDIDVLSKGHIVIPDINMEYKWVFVHTNEIFYKYSLSGNLIKLTMSGSTYILPPQEETKICEALENVYRFVIEDDRSMFYFTEIENKNLLILKKR
jgi:hypothetical protein